MTNGIDANYDENKTQLAWPIRLGVVCEENQIGEQHDQSHKFGLRQNQN